MSKTKLRGSKAIVVVRSAVRASPMPLRQQKDLSVAFANKHEMTIVGELILNGVPHGMPKAHLMSLVSRKKSADDYNVILCADLSRLARDSTHGLHILNTFRNIGVRVICASGSSENTDMIQHLADLAFAFVRRERHLRRQL